MASPIVRKTLVDQLVENLSRDIFLGEFSFGDTLPPIRTLAAQYGVTVPTTQRAIAKIEEMGLVSVRHGSGMTVLDPTQHAGLSAYPHWLDALRSRPEEARQILADFLELRRELAYSLLRRVQPLVGKPDFEPVIEMVNTLERVAQSDADIARIVDADLAIAHALLRLRPQTAYSTIFNVFDRMLRMLPELAIAMYGDPGSNAASWRVLFELMQEHEDFLPMIQPLIEHVDNETLDAFVRALGGE